MLPFKGRRTKDGGRRTEDGGRRSRANRFSRAHGPPSHRPTHPHTHTPTHSHTPRFPESKRPPTPEGEKPEAFAVPPRFARRQRASMLDNGRGRNAHPGPAAHVPPVLAGKELPNQLRSDVRLPVPAASHRRGSLSGAPESLLLSVNAFAMIKNVCRHRALSQGPGRRLVGIIIRDAPIVHDCPRWRAHIHRLFF